MSNWIESKPLRWFYVAMALLLFAFALPFFYVAAKHETFVERLPWCLPGALLMQFVPRMLRAAWTGEKWRI